MDSPVSTDALAGPDGQASMQSSPQSRIDSLIESVQARNIAGTNLRLGNKLAKPLTVEVSPSSAFTFAAIKPTNTEKRSTSEKPQSHEGTIKLPIPSNASQEVLSLQTISRRPEQVLNPVGIQEIAHVSHGDSASTKKQSSPQVVAPVHEKSSDLRELSCNEQAKLSAPGQTLQISATAAVDTPTLIKILAFTYHRETKQQNDLIRKLKTEYVFKTEELDGALSHCQTLEQTVEELHRHVDVLTREIDELKQQLTDAWRSNNAETEVVQQLKAVHTKLDAVLQERHKDRTESTELGKALGVIRQMADELRQYRSQAHKASPQKISNTLANQSYQSHSDPSTNASPLKLQGEDMISQSHPANSVSKGSPVKQHKRLLEEAGPSRDNSEFINQCHHKQGISKCHEKLTEDIVEIQNDSHTSIADPAIPNTNSAQLEMDRRGLNKFGKRSRGDTHSECSQLSERPRSKKINPASSRIIAGTPSKRTCLRSANQSVNVTDLNSIQHKNDSNIVASTPNNHEASVKKKTARGPAGVTNLLKKLSEG